MTIPNLQSPVGDSGNDLNKNSEQDIEHLYEKARDILTQPVSRRRTTNIVAKELADLIKQSQPEFQQNFCKKIALLVFTQATHNPVETSSPQWALLCNQLMLVDPKTRTGGATVYGQGHSVHDHIFYLCNASLDPSGCPENTNQADIANWRHVAKPGHGEHSISLLDKSAERITRLVSDLCGLGTLAVEQVHEYVRRLIHSNTPADSYLVALCELFEIHGHALDIAPWKDATDWIFDWMMSVQLNTTAHGHILTKVETVINFRAKGWKHTNFASLRTIKHLNAVLYPEGINPPNTELNVAAAPGKFVYDRAFLLQFMGICKERPARLPPHHVIGLDPSTATTKPQGRRRVGSKGVSGGPSLQGQVSQASAEIGFGNVSQLAKGTGGRFSVGSFQAPPTQLGDSQSRFEAFSAGKRGAGFSTLPGTTGRLTPMARIASQVVDSKPGEPKNAKRTRSQRGNNRVLNGGGTGVQSPNTQTTAPPEPVEPLRQNENRWIAWSPRGALQHVEFHTLLERKVTSLLNKLTTHNFDSISGQIIRWTIRSEDVNDSGPLVHVTKLVFEKANDEAIFSEMYALLCQRMMKGVSSTIKDETIKAAKGGMLFRKYLLNRCQEDLERGWWTRDAGVAHVATQDGSDKTTAPVIFSHEYYAASKAKRQGLGLVRFMGELFKVQMLTEQIVRDCIRKLLPNVLDPEEGKIEGLCKLLTTVGQSLDSEKGRKQMDGYITRVEEMERGNSINPRMKFMLWDLMELRARDWQARPVAPQPPMSISSSEQKKRNKAASRNATQRSDSHPGDHGGNHEAQADRSKMAGGASAAGHPPAKAGDLSQFGKIARPAGIMFGPSTVFQKKGPRPRDANVSRSNLSASGSIPSASPEQASMPLAAQGGRARKRAELISKKNFTEAQADRGEAREGGPERSLE